MLTAVLTAGNFENTQNKGSIFDLGAREVEDKPWLN